MRLMLLLAVLIQYTPMRVCAIEQVALGTDCHEWADAGGFGRAHADERHCESSGEPTHACICEQPKADGQNKTELKSEFDWAHPPVALVLSRNHPLLVYCLAADPEPSPDSPQPLHVPLLI
jgi:hypothetical protein